MTARIEEAIAVMQRFEREPEHVRQVTRVALLLFDQLEPLHRLGKTDRDVLEAAALLHDIGWSKSPLGKRHHKLAYTMIREHDWKFWSKREIELMANVARYHRKADPNIGHRAFARLPPADQSRVFRLAALLRLADALDRSHRASVRSLRCRDTQGRLTLEIEADDDMALERECLARKSQLFEQVYGREVRLA